MRNIAIACVAIQLISMSASVHAAGSVAGDPATFTHGGSTDDPSCGTGGYFINFLADSTPVAIPDCGGPVRIGPNIVTQDDWIYGGITIAVTLHHTWMGDIRLSLNHDADLDGVAETSALLMCRAGSMYPTCSVGGSRGCPDDLDGTYGFFDAADHGVLGDPLSDCPGGTATPGCYRPVTSLEVFDGQSARGAWWLLAEDCACGDAFRIDRWGSARIGGATPTEPASWGAIKFRYR